MAIERDNGLAVVQSLGRRVLEATVVEDVVDDILLDAMTLTSMSYGALHLVDRDTGETRMDFVQSHTPAQPLPAELQHRIITRVVKSQQSIEFDPLRHQDLPLFGGANWPFALVGLPLLREDVVTGVLILTGTRCVPLSEIEKSLAITLVDLAALAIERTSLYQRTLDSEAIYRSLVDHIPQCVLRKDCASRFTFANKAFYKSLGLTEAEVIGHTDQDLFPEHACEYVGDDRIVMRYEKGID